MSVKDAKSAQLPVRTFKAFVASPRNKSYRNFAHYRAARRCFEFLLAHRDLMLAGMRNANLSPLQAILVDFETYLEQECELERLQARGDFDHFKQMCGAMVRDIVYPEYEIARHGCALRLNRYFKRGSRYRLRTEAHNSHVV